MSRTMRSNIITNVASRWSSCRTNPNRLSQRRTHVMAARSMPMRKPGAAARTRAAQAQLSVRASMMFQ